MPRKTKQVVGPTHLSGDKGTPISFAALSIALRRDAQMSEFGSPSLNNGQGNATSRECSSY